MSTRALVSSPPDFWGDSELRLESKFQPSIGSDAADMKMGYLNLLLPLLCAFACNASHDTTCAPAYVPGTAAYKACLLRSGQSPATQFESSGLHPKFLRPQ